MSDKPEALRLAHDLKDYWEGMESHHVAALHRCAVVMLREQHAEIERLRTEVERLDLNGIHSCHDTCRRLPCVQRREIERLKADAARWKYLKERVEHYDGFACFPDVRMPAPIPDSSPFDAVDAAVDAAMAEGER